MALDHLERTVSRVDLVDWGAERMYSATHIDRWLSHQPEKSIEELLDVPTRGGRIYWAIMRESLLPSALMHHMSIEFAHNFHNQVEGTCYIDFRSPRVIEAKQGWLDGDLSLGALKHAERRAIEAQQLVAELEDPLAHTTAKLFVQLADTDPRSAFRNVYYTYTEAFPSRDTDHRLNLRVREMIAAW